MGFLGLLEKKFITESATVENVTMAMDNRSKVIINYHSGGNDKNTGSRVIEPVAYGLSKAGNPVLRAYQPYGDTTTKTPGWKLFRLDRISYWEETSSKFGKIPDFNPDELNADGDESMSTVIKTYNGTGNSYDSMDNNTGPMTIRKLMSQTSGDERMSLARRNISNMKNGIKVDISNNSKGNTFNMYTDKTQSQLSKGPRMPDQSYRPEKSTIGSVENGDINKDELEKAREQAYGNEFSKYSNGYEGNPEDSVTDRELKDLRNMRDRDSRWKKSSDTRAMYRKDSANKLLKDIDSNPNDDGDEEAF